MRKEDLPDYLQKAFVIFVSEFSGHLQCFDSIVASPEKLASEAIEVSRRFHTIKGGAGFLQLETVAQLAGEGEALFKQEPMPEEAISKLEELARSLRAEYDQLEK